MNGAQSLIRTLVDAGVEVCFANPGTSEMHFVAALDRVPEMRGVNGVANLRNARRAHTPLVDVVGDHGTYHKKYDAPLESDIEAVAGSLQGWVRRSGSTSEIGADAAATIAAAKSHPGQVATLILPADVSWGDGGVAAGPIPPHNPHAVPETRVKAIPETCVPANPWHRWPAGPPAGKRGYGRSAESPPRPGRNR
jgi:acetolactate synthase-1/2/3 large subunit